MIVGGRRFGSRKLSIEQLCRRLVGFPIQTIAWEFWSCMATTWYSSLKSAECARRRSNGRVVDPTSTTCPRRQFRALRGGARVRLMHPKRVARRPSVPSPDQTRHERVPRLSLDLVLMRLQETA